MKAYQEGGILELYDFFFQTSRSLPKGAVMSGSTALSHHQALLISQSSLLVRGLPDALEITVAFNQGGNEKAATRTIPVHDHKSENEYIFPLKGVWYNHAGASIRTHHRWVSNEEFALDLVKLGTDGAIRKGEKEHPTDYYSYGEMFMRLQMARS